MTVLKDGALPTVLREFGALSELKPEQRRSLSWTGRSQQFRRVNDIEYEYGPNSRKRALLHVVECRKQWRETEKGSSRVIEKNVVRTRNFHLGKA